jgi:hypothetical protein
MCTMYDYERSRQIAAQIGCPAGYCYSNAVRALRNRQRFQRHSVNLQGAEYVEGCVQIHGIPIPIQHGWLELPDGTILDPTLAAQHDVEREVKYFPLVSYRKEELKGLRLNVFPLAMIELGQQQTQLMRG